MEELVPIVLFLTVGLVITSFFYLRMRERQALIEKGLSAEQIQAMYVKRPSLQGYTLIKIGIILVFFGIGLGLGSLISDMYLGANAVWDKTSHQYIGDPFRDIDDTADTFMATSIFVFTGAGFIIANLIGKKLEKKEEKNL